MVVHGSIDPGAPLPCLVQRWWRGSNFQSVFRNAEESLWVCVSKLFQRVLWFGAGELRVQLSSCRRTRNLRFIVFLSFSQSRKAHKSRLLVVEGVQFSISNIDIAGLLIEIAFSCCLAVAFLHAYLIRNVFRISQLWMITLFNLFSDSLVWESSTALSWYNENHLPICF